MKGHPPHPSCRHPTSSPFQSRTWQPQQSFYMAEHWPPTSKTDPHLARNAQPLCFGRHLANPGGEEWISWVGAPSGGDGLRVPAGLRRSWKKVASKVRWTQLLPEPHSPFRDQRPDAPLCEGETEAPKMEQKLCPGPQNTSMEELEEAANLDAQWLACGMNGDISTD